MPAFIYLRVSHVDSAKSGLSAEAQAGRAARGRILARVADLVPNERTAAI